MVLSVNLANCLTAEGGLLKGVTGMGGALWKAHDAQCTSVDSLTL